MAARDITSTIANSGSAATAPAIELRGLTKFYGKVRGVEGIDLTVHPQEIFGFLGPNGAGKTTTIRTIMGFLRPTRGGGAVFGKDIAKESTLVRQLVGFVPGAATPYEHLSGVEVLDYLGGLQGSPPLLRDQLCERLQISDRDLHRPLREYSKGMRQKIALIQAFQHDPRLLIMDEPTEGLDPLMQNELFNIIRERYAQGATVFFSSHILPEVERLCERVGIIREGHLVAVEDVRQLQQRRGLIVELRAAAGTALDGVVELSGMTLLERQDTLLRLRYQGDLQTLLTTLAEMPLEELTIQHPSLEEIFLTYYQGEESLIQSRQP